MSNIRPVSGHPPSRRNTIKMRNKERVKGIEPSQPAWKAGALPLSYTRMKLTQRATEDDPHDLRLSRNQLKQQPPATRFPADRPNPPPNRRQMEPGTHSEWTATQDRTNSGRTGERTCHRRAGQEWGKQDSNLRRLSHQIYSLAPLATRVFPPE